MAIFYNKHYTKGRGKWYPKAVIQREVTMEDMMNRIAAISTVSTIDTRAVLYAFKEIMEEELAKGNRVEIGDLCYANLSLVSEGESDSPLSINSNNVKRIKLKITAKKNFQKKFQGIDVYRSKKRSGDEKKWAKDTILDILNNLSGIAIKEITMTMELTDLNITPEDINNFLQENYGLTIAKGSLDKMKTVADAIQWLENHV